MLAIHGLAFVPSIVLGQEAPGNPAAAPAPAPQVAAVADAAAGAGIKVERYVDPRAKQTLAIIKPLDYKGVAIRDKGPTNDLTRAQNMASGLENEDSKFLERYVEYFAAQLSNKDNINALIAPPANLSPNSTAARGLEKAVEALTRPLSDAKFNNKPNFINTYTRILFASSLPKLLDNNYLTRIDAMIVLGIAGGTSPTALDLYTSQLKLSDQVVWVKLWAARGFTNAAQGGRVSLEFSKAITGAEALVGFLAADPKLPYFARFRALEALGSIRVATATRPGLNLDVASVLATHLVDPEARLEVRAYAAWALGMIRVAPQVTPFNYVLVGGEIGNLAGDLGSKIVAEYDAHAANFDRVKDTTNGLTALLMFQVVPAIAGEEGINDSGLLRTNHPGAVAARPFLTKLDEKLKAVGREAFELSRSAGVSQKGRRDSLNAKITDLRTFLDANKPKDRLLLPNGAILRDNKGG